MNRKTKIIIILIILLGLILIFGNSKDISYETLADTDIGSVEVGICGNENATKCIALITGMHPREPLSIGPEIEAAKQFGGDDVKIIHYKVTVTRDAQDYNLGRANGESLVHDYVNPHVTSSDADAVVISHSHIPEYGEGFYVATPQMDDASVRIAKNINQSGDFNYYPVTGNETYKSSSAVLVSKPIAQAGYPTLVYEVPENVFEFIITFKTKDLFNIIAKSI
ncbi:MULTISPECIES: hypothetical protein [Methanobrevibacter]|uniref:hypothetical protein n=1 Tax=Methanobrevibacter TaxID=2172 RepID=UPI0015BD6F1F|nr:MULTISPECIES: hypothetical protein [Methanobrevibacter]MBS7258286.1 hypothetical protein [Methanobrevibacter sp.]MCI7428581.1 hypothetical protein [Methanobrevibacter sp.]MDD6777159.1 hypothetical protein [Methanobacteriaceae archaeon]MDY3096625.1 hypothetical protein [Methanobrevibacter sp.]